VLHHSLVVLLLINYFGEAQPSLDTLTQRYDATCGSRCVWWLMSHYNCPPEDFLNIVLEIQKAPENEATFSDLEEALKKRGINCRFVDVGKLALLKWGEPAIVHIDGRHFAIAKSTSATKALVWMGISGYVEMSSLELYTRMSRIALLTSRRPIAVSVVFTSSSPKWFLGLTSLGCLAVATWSFGRWWKRRGVSTKLQESPSRLPV
jgi:ABC-type bacteriocin/lantibiotic exporter with double-glycine peptidase domain